MRVQGDIGSLDTEATADTDDIIYFVGDRGVYIDRHQTCYSTAEATEEIVRIVCVCTKGRYDADTGNKPVIDGVYVVKIGSACQIGCTIFIGPGDRATECVTAFVFNFSTNTIECEPELELLP